MANINVRTTGTYSLLHQQIKHNTDGHEKHAVRRVASLVAQLRAKITKILNLTLKSFVRIE
jgi:hypothetical protein